MGVGLFKLFARSSRGVCSIVLDPLGPIKDETFLLLFLGPERFSILFQDSQNDFLKNFSVFSGRKEHLNQRIIF